MGQIDAKVVWLDFKHKKIEGNKKMSFNPKLNWKRGPEDNRDLPVTRHLQFRAVELPPEFELDLQIPIYDQEEIGSCVANSGCACYRFESAQLKGDFSFDPSRLFLYYNTRAIEGTTGEDAGAYIRDAFKSMNKTGICDEKLWPYITADFAKKPNTIAYDNGLKNLVVKYTSVDKSLSVIKQTIVSGAAISFGFDVYDSFMTGNWHRTTGMMPKPSGRLLGGHAVAIIGYSDSKQAFLIQNSWGSDWGLKGKFWMPYSFVVSDYCDDFWCIDQISTGDVPPPSDTKKLILAIFATKNELWKVNKKSLLAVGRLLNIAIDESKSFRWNYNLICSELY